MKTLPQLFSEWAKKCPDECRCEDAGLGDYWIFGPATSRAFIQPRSATELEKKIAIAFLCTACERRGWSFGFHSFLDRRKGGGSRLYKSVVDIADIGANKNDACSLTAALSAYLEMIAKVGP